MQAPRFRYFAVGTFLAYVLCISAIMVWQGIGILPDRYFLALLLPVLLAGLTRSFLIDWIPFLLLLISYDLLRSLGSITHARVHYLAGIKLDEWLFGVVPTVALQQHAAGAPFVKWLNGATTLLYVLHFALPLAFAYLLWVRDRAWFREFVAALLSLSYAAWLTYVIFPAAPPWLAARNGYLQGAKNLLSVTLGYFPERVHLPTLYTHLTANDVAAIPSIHAAYPLLVLLFAIHFHGRKGWAFAPYVLAMWFSLVYLGEHYVTDIVLGTLYAGATFIIYRWLRALGWTNLSRPARQLWQVAEAAGQVLGRAPFRRRIPRPAAAHALSVGLAALGVLSAGLMGLDARVGMLLAGTAVVLVSAVLAGRGPAISAAAALVLGSAAFVFPLTGSIAVSRWTGMKDLGALALLAIITIVVVDLFRWRRQSAAAAVPHSAPKSR